MDSRAPTADYRFPITPEYRLASLVLLGLIAIEAIVILWLNNGALVFTLDDPYIHLALAENIFNGHYGVNPQEASAPSSSLLWPLLLAPVTALPFAAYALLLINTVLSLGCLAFYDRVISQIDSEREGSAFTGKTRLLLLLLAILLTNLVGLSYTGMEHVLQVLLSIAIVSGLIQHVQSERTPPWIWIAIILLPLVRFESIVLSGAALLYLVFAREALKSILAGFVILAILVGFSAFLLHLGLGYLPDSVLAKSDVAASGIQKIAFNLYRNLHSFKGLALIVITMLFFHTAWFKSVAPNKRRLMFVMGLAILGHLIGARMGWYFRYELYLWTAALALLFYLYCVPMLPEVSQREKKFTKGLLVTCLVFSGLEHTAAMVTTPLAANNIYSQQYQMQRFLRDHWQQPVAVNDLGLTSYQNPQYVLDLWGLASREARIKRKAAESPVWMAELADRYGIELVMIYHHDVWFAEVPAGWQKLGEMQVTGIPITSRFPVSFFVTDAANAPDVQMMIQAFVKDLPEGAEWVDVDDLPSDDTAQESN